MTKKTQQNLIALTIAVACIVFVYYKYLLAPLDVKYADSYQKLLATESRLAETKRRAMELPQLRAEMLQLQMAVADLEKRLPKDKEIPELLRTLTKTAQHFQLKILNISPGPVTAKANYNEVPFQITAQGTYHSLANFFAELGQRSRILSERNLTITGNPSTKESGTTVNANFTLIAYTYKG